MNAYATPKAKPQNSPVIAKAPRGADVIAAVQVVMKTALEERKVRNDPALAIAAKWQSANAALPPLDRDVSRAVAARQWARFDAAVTRLFKIECAVGKTSPTTLKGASAMLRVAIDANHEDLNPPVLGVLEHVAAFLEREARP